MNPQYLGSILALLTMWTVCIQILNIKEKKFVHGVLFTICLILAVIYFFVVWVRME